MDALEVRNIALLATAFLASAAGSLDLQNRILGQSSCWIDPEIDRIRSVWCSIGGSEFPLGTAADKQSSWDFGVCKFQFDALVSRHADPIDRARLLAVSAPHSGDWLHALPLSACGLRLDNDTVRATIGLRLGAKLCEPHRCPCGGWVEANGLHALACKRSAGRSSRHNYVNDVLWRAIMKAGVPATKEPLGLLRSDGKRPDGVTLIPWESGKCATWDVTVTDTLAASNVIHSSRAAGSAAECAAEKKNNKYT